eukprot:2050000-Prymnesium_polylepis.1
MRSHVPPQKAFANCAYCFTEHCAPVGSGLEPRARCPRRARDRVLTAEARLPDPCGRTQRGARLCLDLGALRRRHAALLEHLAERAGVRGVKRREVRRPAWQHLLAGLQQPQRVARDEARVAGRAAEQLQPGARLVRQPVARVERGLHLAVQQLEQRAHRLLHARLVT